MTIDRFNFVQGIKNSLTRKRQAVDIFQMEGRYPIVQLWRGGKLIHEEAINNGITNEGKNFIFDCMFNSATQSGSSSWVIGIIDSSGYSALNVTDTMASHSTWTEFTGYSQTTRVAWGQSTSSGQTVTNGSPATFDFTATGTLQGIFITNVATKSATTGKLWSTGLFSSTVPVVSGDELKITYAVSA